MVVVNSKKLFKLFKIIVLIVIGIIAIIALKNYKEKKLLVDERERMSSYLTEKYKQDFEVGEVEKKYRGLGAGTDLKAICKDKDSVKFLIERRKTEYRYDDDYAEELIISSLTSEVYEYVKQINSGAEFYIGCSYIGGVANIIDNNVENTDIGIKIVISIPEETEFSQEYYNVKFLAILNKLYSEDFDNFRLRVKFYEKYYKEDIDKYMKLKGTYNFPKQEVVEEDEIIRLNEIYNSAGFAAFEYDKGDMKSDSIEGLTDKWKYYKK